MISAPLVPAASEPVRGRLGARSLTAKLVSGVVVLVTVLVAAIGTATYFELRSFLNDKLDQQLSTAASQNAPFYQRCIEQDGCSSYFGPVPNQHEWVALIEPNGEVFATVSGPRVSRLDLPDEIAADFGAKPDQVRTINYGPETLRLTATTTPSGIVVVTGLSTDDVESTMSRLVVAELVIGLTAIAIAFIATSWGVRFSLRNLRRVTSTANQVAAELSPTGAGLERRVDVHDDGTEVGQLAESMNTLLAAVETQFAARLASENRLRQFLADASHELRTPLTSIRGYAELARMQRAAGADSEDNLARIESEGTRMSRLVEDLLMLARGDQRLPRSELVDIGALLDEAVRGARAASLDRPIDEQLAADLHVVGDPDQLIRVVRNLIANADMHTAAGRPVLVRCAPEGDTAVIQVIDGGPGLPPEEAEHVFERFWRADKARSRVRGGTGLGLSIVAAIVSAHGGTVRFDSSVEYGSTVTVRLPAVLA